MGTVLPSRVALGLSLAACVLAGAVAAQAGTVRAAQKISATSGGFGGTLASFDSFGIGVASLGDLDGDGIPDIAVGASGNDGGGLNEGGVWILFMDADGRVRSEQKIDSTSGGFGGTLVTNAAFGAAVAAPGDLDGDGTVDLAVGANNADPAVWILFLRPDGTVRTQTRIDPVVSGISGFATGVASLGDLDGDGVPDIAVGAPTLGYPNARGGVQILFLNADGTVKAVSRIDQMHGLAGGGGLDLEVGDIFGVSVVSLGDLDGDGTVDLAVGAPEQLGFGPPPEPGTVWILFLNPAGQVKAFQRIDDDEGGFGGELDSGDAFGRSVGRPGDLDGDGVNDLAVGASLDDDGGENRGAVWILFLRADGTVKSERKLSSTSGGFGGGLDGFGFSAAALGDLDGDGVAELGVGAIGDDDGGGTVGALWVLFLEGPPQCITLDFETEDDLATPLVNGQHIDTEFGTLVSISAAGSNLGPATFDSSTGGPNDPGIDSDMLIDRGNLLLLQSNAYPAQTAPGVFDTVTDDADGGDLIFDFVGLVAPASVALADIDPPPNLGASVTLVDIDGATRVYSVPPGWTGTYGDAGPWVLDLATTAPQVGNAPGQRLATATQTAGFQQDAVTRIVVHLTGRGAIDDLRVCARGLARASVRARNGSGVNPRILAAATRPVLGSDWLADLDCAGDGTGIALLSVRRMPDPGRLSPSGEVLISGELLYRMTRPNAGQSRMRLSLPRDLALCGVELHAQGLCYGQSPSARSKTIPVCSRLSNALDLRLGF